MTPPRHITAQVVIVWPCAWRCAGSKRYTCKKAQIHLPSRSNRVLGQNRCAKVFFQLSVWSIPIAVGTDIRCLACCERLKGNVLATLSLLRQKQK